MNVEKVESGFRERVEDIVRQIPHGRVMTYGQIAALAGSAYAARIVGGIAHFGDPDLPWQRVVNKKGGLASGYPGGRAGHAEVLRAEGMHVSDDYHVDVAELLWRPTETKDPPIIFIVGETASGKSSLAIDLAQRWNGEIICADSRTIYEGMDIGTAKPTQQERALVPHHLLDIVTPDKPFSAAEFKERAEATVLDIRKRGKVPLVVGGTGLYVDALLYDFAFRVPVDPFERERLNALRVDELQRILHERGIPLPNNDRNPRHLIRAIETDGQSPERRPIRADAVVYGIKLEREEIVERITRRVRQMLQQGLQDEVKTLAGKYGWDAPGMQTIGYREWKDYSEGIQTLQQTEDRILKSTLQYAKRQRTWFKRNNSIQWIDNREEITKLVVENAPKTNK